MALKSTCAGEEAIFFSCGLYFCSPRILEIEVSLLYGKQSGGCIGTYCVHCSYQDGEESLT